MVAIYIYIYHLLVSETGSMGDLGWEKGSVPAFRENQWTEVSMAVILDVGMRYFVPEEHLALYGDIFDC